MKLFRNILTAVALVAACVTSHAQGSFDLFGSTRTLVLATPQTIRETASVVTNGPIDTHGYVGIGEVTISSLTNALGTVTAQLYTSSDTTNLTALSNFATSTSTTVNVTNLMYGGTALYAANQYLLPGTLTTPTASSAGWATTYLNPAPFTNSAAITITAKGLYKIGYNVADAGRYLYVVYTVTGANTNFTTSAEFTGRRATEVK